MSDKIGPVSSIFWRSPPKVDQQWSTFGYIGVISTDFDTRFGPDSASYRRFLSQLAPVGPNFVAKVEFNRETLSSCQRPPTLLVPTWLRLSSHYQQPALIWLTSGGVGCSKAMRFASRGFIAVEFGVAPAAGTGPNPIDIGKIRCHFDQIGQVGPEFVPKVDQCRRPGIGQD